jgi:hypothetical protein
MCRKALLITWVAVSVLALAGPLSAQSLADVARQEEERRENITEPAKVLTNDDLGPVPVFTPPDSSGAVQNGGAAGETSEAAGGSTPVEGGADGPQGESQSADAPVQDQAYWSGRMNELQTTLNRNETFALALQSRINALTAEYVNQADPVQQAALQTERDNTVAEFGRVTKQIEADKQAIADLQEEARRSGVPAGWLR